MAGVEDGANPGYRFCPTEQQLLSHYLPHKIRGNDNQVSAIAEVDNICNYEPWDLPVLAAIPSEDTWYFFSRRNTTSRRERRVTGAGYWKLTGKIREIMNANHQVIGSKKFFIFYSGHISNSVKTNWVIHEFCLNTPDPNGEHYVITRLRRKTERI